MTEDAGQVYDYRLDPINNDDDYNLISVINQTSHAWSLARTRELSKYGYDLSIMRSAVLMVLQTRDNNATPTEISQWLLREPHTISALLDRMEKDGLVRRFRDMHKKNTVRVAMTEKGRHAYEKSLERDTFHNLMSVLSDTEREQLRNAMTKLWLRALQEVQHEVPWASKAPSHIAVETVSKD
ncbi:MAG: MarR family transcriptional regulator [Dehalococcoidia bacterium]|nr:MarR family transcriptional regulator [Dehalococcoidia bacterium]